MTDIPMQMQHQGVLQKMRVRLGDPVEYQLALDGAGEGPILNQFLGRPVRLEYQGAINCLACNRKTKKSFSQGYCYPCFTKLPQCDSCIVKPETCHFALGTCRDPEWGQRNCFAPHVVYLANSSGLKVGITRGSQVPTRWIDQGAIQALPILEVDTRLQSGLVETLFAKHVADKTNWRAMLKGQVDQLDLVAERDRLMQLCATGLEELRAENGFDAIRELDAQPLEIHYPVINYPTKVSSLNLDKDPVVEGVLQGIKGQYLMLDTGVINLRKFGAYNIKFFA